MTSSQRPVAGQQPPAMDKQLPYSGITLDQFRERITRHAYTAQQRFVELTDSIIARRHTGGPGVSEGEAREHLLAHHATLYGWATVSLIGLIRDRLGDDAAFEAAAMVDDMGENGDAPFTDDLPYPPT